MTTHRVRLFGLSFLLLALSVLPAFAANIRMVRLSLAQGDVQIDRNAGQGWEQAIVNMPVIGGARIYAAEQSKAELEFEDGSSIRLAGPAQITIVQLSSGAKGAPVNIIQVNSGEVYVNARIAHHDDFRIEDAEGTTFAIKQPSRLRFTVDQQTASLAVMSGEAVAQSGEAKVESGKTYNYVLGQPASAASLNTVPLEPEDAWDQQRNTYNDQYGETGAQFSGSDDPNAYGVADLGKYGNYSEVPGYGVMWQPSGVDQDWDPFDNGAWSYYPDWGWTFVSGYDWGWAPFYYGDWCYVGGRGWWWRPGSWHPGHWPGHGGHGPGWHPQPLYSGHPGGKWNAPHAPSGTAQHTTVAVAGSHLQVGPIATTHATNTMPAGTRTSTAGGANVAGHSFVSRTGAPAGGPAGRVGVNSSLVRGSVVVGKQGSYRLANGVPTEHNGFEVHRPASGGQAGNAPRSYQGPSSTVRTYSGPPIAHGELTGPRVSSTPSAAPHVSSAPASAPHASSGGGGGFHGGGGGFSGGGGHGGGGGGGHR